MPLLAAAAALAALVLVLIALIPLSLLIRYRAGSARQTARGWVAAINVVSLGISTVLFLGGAAVTSYWVPESFRFAGAGLAGGLLLGMIGLWATRWEAGPQALHYTPSRLLVLGVTSIVALRILYGFWRAWQATQAGTGESWIVAFGPAQSLAAGAVVIGYYLAFWIGLWRRTRKHQAALLA